MLNGRVFGSIFKFLFLNLMDWYQLLDEVVERYSNSCAAYFTFHYTASYMGKLIPGSHPI